MVLHRWWWRWWWFLLMNFSLDFWNVKCVWIKFWPNLGSLLLTIKTLAGSFWLVPFLSHLAISDWELLWNFLLRVVKMPPFLLFLFVCYFCLLVVFVSLFATEMAMMFIWLWCYDDNDDEDNEDDDNVDDTDNIDDERI